MIGIDPNTGKAVSGVVQAGERLKKAITTLIGTREKRRAVGGEVITLYKLTNNKNRMILINRIYRLVKKPANDLLDIHVSNVDVKIINAGFRIKVSYLWKGEKGTIDL